MFSDRQQLVRHHFALASKLLMLIAVMLLAAAPATDTMAQSNRKKPATTRKTSPKSTARKPQSKQTAQKKAPAQAAPHVFEGSLLYRNYEYNSAAVRKFSQGRAYNGERTILVTVKGNAIHVTDADMHIHTIIRPAERLAFQYSDVTNEGLRGGQEFINTFLAVYDPDVQVSNIKKTFSVMSKDAPVTFKKHQCSVFRGQLNSGGSSDTDVEMWGSKTFLAPKAYKYAFWGLPTGKGIVMKGIYSQTGAVPFLGKMTSSVATELMAYKEYRVRESELQVPSQVRIKPYTQPSQLTKFYKDNTKALKKKGLYPKIQKTKEAKYNITSQWDFADGWIAKKPKLDYMAITWKLVDEMLESTKQVLETIAGVGTDNNGYAYSDEEMPDQVGNGSASKRGTSRKSSTQSRNQKKKTSSTADKQNKQTSSTSESDNKPAEKPKCHVCGGDGKCRDCYFNKGSGKCSSCEGTGHLSHKVNGKYVGCPNCRFPGNGKCKPCDGSGKCSWCNGSGTD